MDQTKAQEQILVYRLRMSIYVAKRCPIVCSAERNSKVPMAPVKCGTNSTLRNQLNHHDTKLKRRDVLSGLVNFSLLYMVTTTKIFVAPGN